MRCSFWPGWCVAAAFLTAAAVCGTIETEAANGIDMIETEFIKGLARLKQTSPVAFDMIETELASGI